MVEVCEGLSWTCGITSFRELYKDLKEEKLYLMFDK